MIYLRAIRKVKGVQASAVPLYLPADNTNDELDKKVFFGAISMYLRGKVSLLKKMPVFFDRILDSGPMLRMAAKRAGTTRTEGLEDLTLDMIKGENAFPENELRRLVEYLCRDGKPDVIHLSNALIIGLARQLKNIMKVSVVCSLLNEDDWIDEMAEPFQSDAWRLIAREAENVDAFLTPSAYFSDFFRSKTGIPESKVHIVPLGLEARDLVSVEKKENWPAIGYFCRVNYMNGFDKLADAFILLKSRGSLPGLTLHVSGGFTGDDKPFIAEQMRKIGDAGFSDSVIMYSEFHGESKHDFFSNIDLMSVPVRKYDGYGLYLLEANAAGVPFVQPATGAFPEIVLRTGGGMTYLNDDVSSLADAIEQLLFDRQKIRELGRTGKERVLDDLSLERMSDGLSNVYSGIIINES
jgi:glycosyltransferase involved in cell wall biosynthesis